MTFDEWCKRDGVYLDDDDDAAKAARLLARHAWCAAVAAERERLAKLLDAEHELRKHLDNHAGYYARLIRESATAPAPVPSPGCAPAAA